MLRAAGASAGSPVKVGVAVTGSFAFGSGALPAWRRAVPEDLRHDRRVGRPSVSTVAEIQWLQTRSWISMASPRKSLPTSVTVALSTVNDGPLTHGAMA